MRNPYIAYPIQILAFHPIPPAAFLLQCFFYWIGGHVTSDVLFFT